MDEACTLLQKYSMENPSDTVAQIYRQRCKKDTKEKRNWAKNENTVAWSQELSTGISLIDEQHRQMFDQINLLIEIIRQGRGEDKFFKTVTDLKEYTALHFKTEEDMMVKFDYPDYEDHKNLHKKYSENFDRLINVIKHMGYKEREDGLHLLLRIQHLLAEWLFNHVAGADKKLGDFLKQHNY